MKTIGITGGTGFVGTELTKQLKAKGYNIIVFTRHPQQSSDSQLTYAHWDPYRQISDVGAMQKVDALVHLAGAGIADKRWTNKRKKEIVESRTKTTEFLVRQMKEFGTNCRTLVAASAIGYYGPDREGMEPFHEDAPPYNDFLAKVCVAWEDEATKATDAVRTVMLRFGVVMGKESGAFPKFSQPLKFGVMPILSSGGQVISWISVHDLCRMILYALDDEQISGVYNAVAPSPIPNKKLMRTIAHLRGGLHIPVPVPAFLLKLLLGEMSEEILKSCTVSAEKITQMGFRFQHNTIEEAVRAILHK